METATSIRHTVIETPLGPVGLAWRAEGAQAPLVRVQLPAGDAVQTERALTRRLDSARADLLPPPIRRLAGMIGDYARGEPVDFSQIAVDFGEVDPLRQTIYAVLRRLRHGETLTYGQLAERAGIPGQAQTVGQAMGRNPVPLVVPCHRVLAAGGKIGGFSAPGGIATKQAMLRLEGAFALPAQADLFG
jgi:methylated-DNA-[protein]-cysteine S-methyltransferase